MAPCAPVVQIVLLLMITAKDNGSVSAGGVVSHAATDSMHPGPVNDVSSTDNDSNVSTPGVVSHAATGSMHPSGLSSGTGRNVSGMPTGSLHSDSTGGAARAAASGPNGGAARDVEGRSQVPHKSPSVLPSASVLRLRLISEATRLFCGMVIVLVWCPPTRRVQRKEFGRLGPLVQCPNLTFAGQLILCLPRFRLFPPVPALNGFCFILSVSNYGFICLEKKRAADRWVAALHEADGTLVSSPCDHCPSFAGFYSSLFSASPRDSGAQDHLFDNVTSTLPSNQTDLCEGRLTLGECHAALLGMAKRKAPGSDSLPMEFCVFLGGAWPGLGRHPQLLLCFWVSVLVAPSWGHFPHLQPGDRLDACNWCPIFLLNVDYKFASRVLAGRLLRSSIWWLAGTRLAGFQGGSLGRTSLFSGMFSTMPACPTPLLPFFSWTRKRPLIEWIGSSCSLPCLKWASVHPFFAGSVCCIQVSRVV